jgi:hypothetical protein
MVSVYRNHRSEPGCTASWKAWWPDKDGTQARANTVTGMARIHIAQPSQTAQCFTLCTLAIPTCMTINKETPRGYCFSHQLRSQFWWRWEENCRLPGSRFKTHGLQQYLIHRSDGRRRGGWAQLRIIFITFGPLRRRKSCCNIANRHISVLVLSLGSPHRNCTTKELSSFSVRRPVTSIQLKKKTTNN